MMLWPEIVNNSRFEFAQNVVHAVLLPKRIRRHGEAA